MTLPMVNTARYSVHLPGSGKDVEYRPFFVKEQKIMLQATESDDPAQISAATSDMLKACTFEKINIDDLTSSDIEYLMLKIRTKSVGETSEVSVKCQHCEKQNTIKINLDKIEPKGKPIKDVKVKITDTVGVAFRAPTLNQLKKFMAVSGGTATDTILSTIAASIEYVYDENSVYSTDEQSAEEVIQFLESLSAQQYTKIQEVFDDFPRLTCDVNFKCKHCGEENNIQLGGIGDFLN